MPGRVVDFTINGFGLDKRSAFPFQFTTPSPGAAGFYTVQVDFETAWKFIHNVRGVTVEYDLACAAPVGISGGSTTYTRDIPNEQSIRELMSFNGVGWSPDGFWGGVTEPPMTGSGDNYSLAFFVGGSVSEEGEDNSIINTVVSQFDFYPEGQRRLSAVQGSFWGFDFPLYEDNTSPALTGTITVTPTSFWSYDGRFDTSTGAPI